jgi:hypothetical protein
MMAAALFNWTETSFFAIAVVLLGIPVFYLWKQTIDKRQMKVQRSENKK